MLDRHNRAISVPPFSNALHELVMPYEVGRVRSTNFMQARSHGKSTYAFVALVSCLLGGLLLTLDSQLHFGSACLFIVWPIIALVFLSYIMRPNRLQVGSNGIRLHWLSQRSAYSRVRGYRGNRSARLNSSDSYH